MSFHLKLLVSIALTIMSFLASNIESLQWLQRLLGSSAALPGLVARNHSKQLVTRAGGVYTLS